jgi:sodium transport system permease protein
MWIVLKKELLELLRERRTLIFTFLMPTVIIPLLMGGFGLLLGHKSGQEAERVLRYAVFGIENAPELDQRLHAAPLLVRSPLASADLIDETLKNQRLDFVLVVPPGFEQALANGRRMELELHYNDAVKVDTTARRMRLLTTAYGVELRQRYLAAHQVDEAGQRFIAEPISIAVKSIANQRERVGEWIGAFLPYFFLLIGLSASIPAAMDMAAGEKERGTLETLLLLPLPRSRIVLGKFCAVALLGSMAGLVGVASLAIWGLGLIKGAGGAADALLNGIGAGDVALVGLMILPANAIIASVLLSISFYGRSYREAVNYASALVLVLVGPILLSLLPNMQLSSGWAWMPITNISLAVKESIKGTLTFSDFCIVFASTTLVAGGLLALCTAWCKRESVLFRN